MNLHYMQYITQKQTERQINGEKGRQGIYIYIWTDPSDRDSKTERQQEPNTERLSDTDNQTRMGAGGSRESA